MNVPCKDCICKPICRHKNYNVLIDHCGLIKSHLYSKTENIFASPEETKIFWEDIDELVEELETTAFRVIDNGKKEDYQDKHIRNNTPVYVNLSSFKTNPREI